MYLLDSNTCIRFLNGASISIERRLRGTRPLDVKLCAIVKAELLYGAAGSVHPSTTRTLLQGFFSHYESFSFDDNAAVEYGRIRRDLASKGTPIGANDLTIASIARSLGLTVVTHNLREFTRVQGLSVEDWEQ